MISKHEGMKAMQGMNLFLELGEDCVKCLKKRKKFLDISIGTIADEQLTVAPAFWIIMCNIFGPC